MKLPDDDIVRACFILAMSTPLHKPLTRYQLAVIDKLCDKFSGEAVLKQHAGPPYTHTYLTVGDRMWHISTRGRATELNRPLEDCYNAVAHSGDDV